MNLNNEINKFQNSKMIGTLKTIQFIENGKVIKGIYWRTIKVKELFAYLVQHKSASKQELIELLWPNFDEDRASKNLYTTIYQIKETLASINFDIDIVNTVGRYELILNEVQVDVDIFEKVFNDFDSITSENYKDYMKLMQFYHNDYLKEEDFTWKTGKSEEFKIYYITMLYNLIDYLKGVDKNFHALLLALTVKKHYPSFQNIYLTLMELYNEIGDYSNVRLQYKTLQNTIGNPNDYIKEWYINWEKNVNKPDNVHIL